MRFYNLEGELNSRRLERTYGAEAEIVLSMLDCALNGQKVLYGSSELTTGRRFYRLAQLYGVKDSEELRAKIGEARFVEELWEPNLRAASDFARNIRLHYQEREIVLTPGPFAAPGWSQPEYLAFWETLIRTRLRAAWFNDGWEYSSGCTFEFSVAIDAGLSTFDSEGEPLSYDRGLALSRHAVAKLERDGFDVGRLRGYVARLEAIRARQVS